MDIGIAAGWLLLSLVVGIAAGRRDRGSGAWFLVSLFLSPLMATVLLVALGPGGRTCPRCREKIRQEATVCRFCGADFVGRAPDQPAPRGRVRWPLVALGVGPLLLALAHSLALDAPAPLLGLLWLGCLVVVGAASAIPSLQSKSSNELIEMVRARPLVWRSAVGVFALCEVLTLVFMVTYKLDQRRARQVLQIGDPCARADAWSKLGEKAQHSLPEAERSPGVAAPTQCGEEQSARARTSYVESCRNVIAHLQTGELTPADVQIIAAAPATGIPAETTYASGQPDATALAARIAKGALLPGDLLLPARLPCGAGARLAFMGAAAKSAGAWADIRSRNDVSEEIVGSLGARPLDPTAPTPKIVAPMSAAAKAALHKNAEETAALILAPKALSDCEQPLGLCLLDRRFGTPLGKACENLLKTALRLEKVEADAAKAADANCQGRLTTNSNCKKRCDAAQPKDELGMPAGDFDQAMECYERCDKSASIAGCR